MIASIAGHVQILLPLKPNIWAIALQLLPTVLPFFVQSLVYSASRIGRQEMYSRSYRAYRASEHEQLCILPNILSSNCRQTLREKPKTLQSYVGSQLRMVMLNHPG
ncbi:hypothetical protein BDN72DRAFT_547422 [Pluteus cervinus]|uniref:Uncharacterized protein n=1 Tax=Pluteus cervinus TaxID=181527 RepID=A0ACD3AX42_9AGAR|nr:hypothetical protein BDN72DRAFT_547422 [Pluteus cervinus]